MDSDLKLLADASLHVGAAEEALAEGAFLTAGERLDGARVALADLRVRWPELSFAERAVVGPAAREVRTRLDQATKRVPPVSAVSEGVPVVDPEQEIEPEAA